MNVQQLIELLGEFEPEVPIQLCCTNGPERWLTKEVWLDPKQTSSEKAFTLFFDLKEAEPC